MTDWSTKVAVITGGANGMGEAVARTLAGEGASVVIVDKDAERAPLVADDIVTSGGKATAIIADVGQEDQVRALVERVIRSHGRIDIMDNNAAALELVPEDGRVADVTTDLLQRTLQVNLLGPFFLCKYVLPHMVAAGGGSIINMASISGLTGEAGLSAYGISKSGVIQLTRAVAGQYGKSGVRCNAVAPSLVLTPNYRSHGPAWFTEVYERHSMTPFVGEPQDVANVVVFLASDESRYMSGHVVYADGGIAAVNPILADTRAHEGDDRTQATEV